MARYARLAKASAAFLLLTLAACGGKEEAVTDLTIDPGFVRMPAEGALSTAAYLEITSPEDDRLLAATSPMATVEIHTMTMLDGVMTMRKLDVLELPAGETVALEQGGDHLMLFNPDAALTSAESAEFTLTFEKAGEVTVTIPVKKASGHAH